jgi:NifU-like protein involved in Fe-S cluster formation
VVNGQARRPRNTTAPSGGRVASRRNGRPWCGSAIASSSLVTEWVKGKSLDQALTIKNTQIAEELALPPVKIHCSILAEDAIKAAVADYKQKHGHSAGSAEYTACNPPKEH